MGAGTTFMDDRIALDMAAEIQTVPRMTMLRGVGKLLILVLLLTRASTTLKHGLCMLPYATCSKTIRLNVLKYRHEKKHAGIFCFVKIVFFRSWLFFLRRQ